MEILITKFFNEAAVTPRVALCTLHAIALLACRHARMKRALHWLALGASLCVFAPALLARGDWVISVVVLAILVFLFAPSATT